jgi:hypothetical protein
VKEREAPKQTAAEPEDELVEIDKIMQGLQESLAEAGAKPTVADLIRLLELRRELARSQSSRVTVRWIDECQPTPARGE